MGQVCVGFEYLYAEGVREGERCRFPTARKRRRLVMQERRSRSRSHLSVSLSQYMDFCCPLLRRCLLLAECSSLHKRSPALRTVKLLTCTVKTGEWITTRAVISLTEDFHMVILSESG